jgi:site-specific recombinase XerD
MAVISTTRPTRSRAIVPALYAASPKAAHRFLEFFAANIRNVNTRRAYFRAVREFSSWCVTNDITEIIDVEPVHVAAYIEALGQRLARPSVKQHLAALRVLFDWLVVGQIVGVNPAAAVRGPRYTVRRGKTPVLTAEETRALLDSIDTSTPVGLRDRALIATMVYTFGRIGAVNAMRVGDYFSQGRRGWVRLHEKGGKHHQMPCNHQLENFLDAYLSGAAIAHDARGFLFRTARRRSGELTTNPMSQADAYRMIQRRARAAGIVTRIGNHSFRATGITQYLKRGGRRELAQQMAGHESPRTTALYDRRDEEIAIEEVERIVF